MSFAAAVYLFGALAIAGPLLAHFWARPRYRRIPFTMLRFLQTGQAEIESRRRLRDLLILLYRCAVVVLLALLFAGPQFATVQQQSRTRSTQFIALDNSLSTRYRENGESLFERIKQFAREAVDSAEAETVFRIYALAANEPAREMTRSEAQDFLIRLQPSNRGATIRPFLSDLRSAHTDLAARGKLSALVLSDFTQPVREQFENKTEAVAVDHFEYKSVFPTNAIANCSIDEGAIESMAEGRLTIQSLLWNDGEEAVNRTLEIRQGQSVLASQEVELETYGRKTIRMEIPLPSPPDPCIPIELALNESDTLSEDDRYCMAIAFQNRDPTRVLLVGKDAQETFLLKTALETLSQYNPSELITIDEYTATQLTPELLRSTGVIIFASVPRETSDRRDVLQEFVRHGGKIVYCASPNSDTNSLARLWETGILPAYPQALKHVNTHVAERPEVSIAEHPTCLDASAIPSLVNYQLSHLLLTGYYSCEVSTDTISLWRIQDGPGFLYYKPLGSGSLLFLNSSADDSLGTILKSPAAVAFCRYLLGKDLPFRIYATRCGDAAVLPNFFTPSTDRSQENTSLWAVTPGGMQVPTTATEMGLLIEPVDELGWIKTISSPIAYAGINPPLGETRFVKPNEETLAQILNRIFVIAPQAETTVTQFSQQTVRPVWKEVGWLLLGALVVEMLLTNRMKR